ncbi:MAG: zf-HC2 domain-containing protein, partial [Acidimicrobiales bacterium]|nr:zf-HC2 domain-containing protein [Acidimicrobiales bacterium]
SAHLADTASGQPCAEIARHLPAHVAGSLRPDRVAVVDQHLAACAPCAALHASLRDDTAKLRGLLPLLPTGCTFGALAAKFGIGTGATTAAKAVGAVGAATAGKGVGVAGAGSASKGMGVAGLLSSKAVLAGVGVAIAAAVIGSAVLLSGGGDEETVAALPPATTAVAAPATTTTGVDEPVVVEEPPATTEAPVAFEPIAFDNGAFVDEPMIDNVTYQSFGDPEIWRYGMYGFGGPMTSACDASQCTITPTVGTVWWWDASDGRTLYDAPISVPRYPTGREEVTLFETVLDWRIFRGCVAEDDDAGTFELLPYDNGCPTTSASGLPVQETVRCAPPMRPEEIDPAIVTYTGVLPLPTRVTFWAPGLDGADLERYLAAGDINAPPAYITFNPDCASLTYGPEWAFQNLIGAGEVYLVQGLAVRWSPYPYCKYDAAGWTLCGDELTPPA